MRGDVQRAPRAWRARTRRFGPILFLIPVLACSSALRGYDVAPNGLDRDAEWLRRTVASGRADSALKRLRPVEDGVAPTDAVLRLLYQGTVAYHAGDYLTSVASFDSAAWLADDRTAIRLSREAAALFSNDRALPYEPDRTERLFNAYYAALGYIRLHDRDDAAVEARRISYILETTDEDVDPDEAPLHAVMRYLAGVLYEIAGDYTNADVAYRNAASILPALIAPPPLRGDSGDVLLIIEDGFVAHRVQQSLTLVLATDEHERLHDDDRDVRDRAADELAMRVIASAFNAGDEYGIGPRTGRRDWFIPAPKRPHRHRCEDRPKHTDRSADAIATRGNSGSTGSSASTEKGATSTDKGATSTDKGATSTDKGATSTDKGATSTDKGATSTDKGATSAEKGATSAETDSTSATRSAPSGRVRSDPDRGHRDSDCDDDDRTYILRMAWPAYHADRRPATSAQVFYDGVEAPAPVFADVNDAVLAAYDRERPTMLARTIARSAAKYALVQGAEDIVGEGNEGFGRLLGTIANISTAVLEQADTRSWTLLPGGIGVTRIRLPAGTHDIKVVVGANIVVVKDVKVGRGVVRVETVRVW